MLKTTVSAAAWLAVSLSPALALSVTKTMDVAAPPDAVWKTIGGFCGIGEWHPAVEKCTLGEQGKTQTRSLDLKGGGTLLEAEKARSDKKMSYTYTILEGPLPVSGYRSTLTVKKAGAGSKLTWTGSFKAKGAPDAKAKEVIGGIYEAGLKGIADKTK